MKRLKLFLILAAAMIGVGGVGSPAAAAEPAVITFTCEGGVPDARVLLSNKGDTVARYHVTVNGESNAGGEISKGEFPVEVGRVASGDRVAANIAGYNPVAFAPNCETTTTTAVAPETTTTTTVVPETTTTVVPSETTTTTTAAVELAASKGGAVMDWKQYIAVVAAMLSVILPIALVWGLVKVFRLHPVRRARKWWRGYLAKCYADTERDRERNRVEDGKMSTSAPTGQFGRPGRP